MNYVVLLSTLIIFSCIIPIILDANARIHISHESDRERILAAWEKSKEITGIGLIVKEPKAISLEKLQYIPELLMTTSHDFRTYWQDTFNIDVQTYDGKINPKAAGFEGRLDNANVTVTLSYEDTEITMSGVTIYGNWDGEYYFPENISMPGEYTVDVIVSHYNQTVSKSSSMFVIADVLNNKGVNRDYDNDGILNIFDQCPYDAEDFKRLDRNNEPMEDEVTLSGDGCPEPLSPET